MFLRNDPDGIGFYILGKKVKLISRLFIQPDGNERSDDRSWLMSAILRPEDYNT